LSKYYQDLDSPGGFDYELFTIPELGARTFRGPVVDLSAPYVAVIGGAQTFGRFVSRPFPSLLADRLDLPVLNLGIGGAGPRHFRSAEYRDVIANAETVVVQVLSGRSASNSMFDNRASGGIAGHLAKDGSAIRSDKFFSGFMQTASESEVRRIVAETRADYMAEFRSLLKCIERPKILFWFSTRQPDYEDDYSALPFGVLRSFPQLVNRTMVEELAALCDDRAECVSREGLPQSLWESDSSIDGAQASAGMLENHYYPSPAMHAAAADALERPCRRTLGCYPAPKRRRRLQKFVIVAAERTGTNLLIGLLRDYPRCLIGNELFNPVNYERGVVPWPDVPEPAPDELLDLRRSNPVRFWDRLAEEGGRAGFRTIGFKLLYAHGLAQPDLLDHLARDKATLIIHLKRRNLLRRLISERQASVTGTWAVSGRKTVDRRPKVAISMEEILSSFRLTEERAATFAALFADHRVLDIAYEDLADRPLETAARAARFLGLEPPVSPPTVKYSRTGADRLEDALVEFAVLRARMLRWSAFFND
jgi:LPS sulfotransferase NodH